MSELRQRKGSRAQQIFQGGLIPYDEAPPPPTPAPSKIANFLGLQELRTLALWRAGFIESIATCLVTFLSAAIVTTSAGLGLASPPIAIALAHSALIAFYILASAAPSGGHLNPTITLATVGAGLTTPTRGFFTLSRRAWAPSWVRRSSRACCRKRLPKAPASAHAHSATCLRDRA